MLMKPLTKLPMRRLKMLLETPLELLLLLLFVEPLNLLDMGLKILILSTHPLLLKQIVNM
jgi:hypothetical protein